MTKNENRPGKYDIFPLVDMDNPSWRPYNRGRFPEKVRCHHLATFECDKCGEVRRYFRIASHEYNGGKFFGFSQFKSDESGLTDNGRVVMVNFSWYRYKELPPIIQSTIELQTGWIIGPMPENVGLCERHRQLEAAYEVMKKRGWR